MEGRGQGPPADQGGDVVAGETAGRSAGGGADDCKTGAELVVAPIDARGQLETDALFELLDERVKMLAIGHVSNALGTVNPVKEMIRMAHEQGKKIHVFVDETRPRLQGARLTAWELMRDNIPMTLIADNPTPPDAPHPGQCAEYCGLAHADMRIKVHVRTQADFDAWVADQLNPAAVPTEGAAAAGYEAFTTCIACHNATVAGPEGVEDLYREVFALDPDIECACHFHNTYGLALANDAFRAALTSERWDAVIDTILSHDDLAFAIEDLFDAAGDERQRLEPLGAASQAQPQRGAVPAQHRVGRFQRHRLVERGHVAGKLNNSNLHT